MPTLFLYKYTYKYTSLEKETIEKYEYKNKYELIAYLSVSLDDHWKHLYKMPILKIDEKSIIIDVSETKYFVVEITGEWNENDIRFYILQELQYYKLKVKFK